VCSTTRNVTSLSLLDEVVPELAFDLGDERQDPLDRVGVLSRHFSGRGSVSEVAAGAWTRALA
jgi:hypothetical protein